MTLASNNSFPSILLAEGAAPASPAAGTQRLFVDSADSLVKRVNSAGAVAPACSGAWTSYTPTLTATTTNPVLGSSTVTGRYKRLDANTVIVRVQLAVTTGGAWSAGSGEWKFSLPAGLTAAGTLASTGSAHILDAGTTRFSGAASVQSGAAVVHPIVVGDGATTKILGDAIPVTWATGDQVDVQVLVELA